MYRYNQYIYPRLFASQRVRSISFPGSTPVCPMYIQIALTSFQVLTLVSPKCPACGVGHLGLVAPGACRHHERVSDRSISSCQGLTPSEHRGVGMGKLIERTHWWQVYSVETGYHWTVMFIACDRFNFLSTDRLVGQLSLPDTDCLWQFHPWVLSNTNDKFLKSPAIPYLTTTTIPRLWFKCEPEAGF